MTHPSPPYGAPPLMPVGPPPAPPLMPVGPPPGPPAPPPGPGVQPPFVAPPTDGARQRRWLALGLAGAALVICCVGGLFAAGGVVVLGNQMVLEEAQGTVTAYLTAVRDRDYAKAYTLLCDSRQDSIDEGQFVDTFERSPTLRSFTVGQPVVDQAITVPATLSYADGRSSAVRYVMAQDGSTGRFEVCGETG